MVAQGFLMFGASFLYVLLKAFQQLSVVHSKYAWVMPGSMLMAMCEFTVIGIIVKNSFWFFIPMGLGAGLGCMLAMMLHKKFRGDSV